MNRCLTKRNYFNEIAYSLFIILIFSLLSSSRFFGEGADYANYKDIFEKNILEDRHSIEPAFVILRIINDCIFDSWISSVFFITSSLALCLKVHAFKNLSLHPKLSMLLYLVSFYFLHEYTQIRVAVAIGIFLLSLEDLVNEKKLRYFLKMLLALTFHYSAILMLFCWFFVRLSKRKNTYFFLVCLSYLFSFIGKYIWLGILKTIFSVLTLVHLEGRLGFTSDISLMSILFTSIHFIPYLIFTILLVNNEMYKINIVLYKVYSFYLCAFYCLLPLGMPVVSSRVSEFFMVTIVILSVNLADNVKEKIIYLIFIIFYILYRSYTIILSIHIL